MRKPTKKTQSASRQRKPKKSKMKLVGYWEERKLAESIHAALQARGIETSEFLRNAYRSAQTNGDDPAQILLKESKMAKLLDTSKSKLREMRDAGLLKDDQGELWRTLDPTSRTIYYDVDRTRRFFTSQASAGS